MRGLGLVAVLFCVALVLGIVTMPLPRTLFYWGNICICAGQSETGKKPSKGKLLSPPVPRKCSASENHFYLGSTFIGLLSQDQRGSSIKATTTSIVVTWPPIKRSNMTGWMAATSAGEKKKKTNSVIFREYCMDLVSLETQQENDYIQNWLDSRNLTYTWTSGRWAYIQCPHTFIILWYKHRNIWSTIPTTGFVTLTAVTDQTCSPSVSRGGFGRGPTRRLHQPTKSMTGKTWMGALKRGKAWNCFPNQPFLLQLGIQAMEQHWPSEEGPTRQCRVRYQQVRQLYKSFPW